MNLMKVESQVGADGVLVLRVPLGPQEAGHRVVVTIEPVAADNAPADADWHEFVEQTYGSCAGLGLERQDQGKLVERGPLE